MARPLRLQFAGALYHITTRGDGREDIYLSDDDRDLFLMVLAQVRKRFNWRIHAYCLMNNHYHLLVETSDGNLSAGMRQLNGVYTQRFNRTHYRVGHVFQGRYKGILVEKDPYLLELSRYIVLNPVRAGMAQTPEEWVWSSYRAMTGKVAVPDWLETRSVLARFGATERNAARRYGAFVAAGVGNPSPWMQLKHPAYLGSERFIEKMERKIPKEQDLREVPQARRRKPAKSLAAYAASYASRDEAIRSAYASEGAYAKSDW